MKLLVDKMPESHFDCLFSSIENEYDVCKISGDACSNVKKCPFLKVPRQADLVLTFDEFVERHVPKKRKYTCCAYAVVATDPSNPNVVALDFDTCYITCGLSNHSDVKIGPGEQEQCCPSDCKDFIVDRNAMNLLYRQYLENKGVN